ncbi:MAG: phosphate acyltransferase PlsX [Bdellovibrionales bacterium]
MSNSKKVTIAIDAMGGDLGVEMTIPGAARALEKHSNIHFMIFGDESRIRPVLSRYPTLKTSAEIIHTDQFISNREKPAVALRKGRGSSMRLAINAVHEGKADCVVSAGNTGALMAMAKMVLKCLPDIRRPAIASVMPTRDGRVVMLDLGANLACDSEVLVQFALLGAVYSKVVDGKSNPTVGLLNVGSEDVKGHEELRTAAAVLERVSFAGKYHGFVEGDDIPMGTTDVVVTDGFTGNIALKTAEGVAKLSSMYMKDAFKSSPIAMLGGLLASCAIKRAKAKVDPRLYNGGMFLGLDGVCVKSHGGTDEVGFANALQVAYNLIDNKFNEQVAKELENLMSQESFFTSDIEAE